MHTAHLRFYSCTPEISAKTAELSILGVVGLTENPVTLKRWVVAGPETARIMEEFEHAFLPEADLDINYRHHEEGASAQEKFRKQASSLINVINEYGNPSWMTAKNYLS